MYTIGELANSAGVNVETVRYYEKQQLIQQPCKPAQGYRQYPAATLTRILFIKRAQQLGFTLTEISSLLKLSSGHCSDIQELAESKLELIRQKIADLQQMETSLNMLIGACRHNPDETTCPIIESLVPKSNA